MVKHPQCHKAKREPAPDWLRPASEDIEKLKEYLEDGCNLKKFVILKNSSFDFKEISECYEECLPVFHLWAVNGWIFHLWRFQYTDEIDVATVKLCFDYINTSVSRLLVRRSDRAKTSRKYQKWAILNSSELSFEQFEAEAMIGEFHRYCESALSEDEKRLLKFQLAEMTHREIAVELHIVEGTVRYRIRKLREKISKFIDSFVETNGYDFSKWESPQRRTPK